MPIHRFLAAVLLFSASGPVLLAAIPDDTCIDHLARSGRLGPYVDGRVRQALRTGEAELPVFVAVGELRWLAKKHPTIDEEIFLEFLRLLNPQLGALLDADGVRVEEVWEKTGLLHLRIPSRLLPAALAIRNVSALWMGDPWAEEVPGAKLVVAADAIVPIWSGLRSVEIFEGHRDLNPGPATLSLVDENAYAPVEILSVAQTDIAHVDDAILENYGLAARSELAKMFESRFRPRVNLDYPVTVVTFRRR